MSIDHDDDLAARLRTLADAELPELELDPVAVTRAGRRRRRRRNVRNGALVTLACAALAVGISQLDRTGLLEAPDTGPAQSSQDAPPAPDRTTPEPRTFGDEQTVELAPGVVAANRPVQIEVEGHGALDLGFTTQFVETIDDAPTRPGPTVLVGVEPIELGAARRVGAGVQMRTRHGDELFDAMSTTWVPGDSPEDYAAGGGLVSTVGLGAWSYDQLTLGSVPSWLDSPHVLLFSERGFVLEDGREVHTLEVPTFRAPTTDERLVFAVKITEEQGKLRRDDAELLVDVVAYRSGDGSVYVGDQCGADGVAGCLDRYGDAWHAVLEPEAAPDSASLAGAVVPRSLDGVPLPLTRRSIDDAVPRGFADVFAPVASVPAVLPSGDEARPMAVTPDGRIVLAASPPESFSGDVFLAPERLGWWTAAGFTPFDDVSGVPEGDPFRYSYFAATDGESVTWVETSSIQGTGRWRIFASSPSSGTRLVAYAEQPAEPDLTVDHDFGGDAEPRPFGDRAVWTSYPYTKPRASERLLLSAPLDGSGPMRVESHAASNVAVTRDGAAFAREGGSVISLLRKDGGVEDLLRYAFEEEPLLSLEAEGNLLTVSARFRDAPATSWIDVIDLDTMSVTRVQGAESIWPMLHVCGSRVVWSSDSDDVEESTLSTFVLDPASGTLTAIQSDDGGFPRACGGSHVVWFAPDATSSRHGGDLVELR